MSPERSREGAERVAPCRVFVVRTTPAAPLEAMRAAARALRGGTACVPEVDLGLRTLVCGSTNCSPRRHGLEIASAVEGTIGVRPWVAVVVSTLPAGVDEARLGERWIELASLLVGPRVIDHADVGFIRRLVHDRAELASILEPLVEHDRRMKTDVLSTLHVALLTVPGSRAIARVRGMNRHTVSRHLNLAASVLGRNVRWGFDRLIVEHALLARSALCRREPPLHPDFGYDFLGTHPVSGWVGEARSSIGKLSGRSFGGSGARPR